MLRKEKAPHIITIRVNEALADPETLVPDPAEVRLQEVVEANWNLTSELAQYGSYRRNGPSWIVPTRDESGRLRERTVSVITPDASINDDFSEVFVHGFDQATTRSFLMKGTELDRYTHRFERHLMMFHAPEPEALQNTTTPDQ